MTKIKLPKEVDQKMQHWLQPKSKKVTRIKQALKNLKRVRLLQKTRGKDPNRKVKKVNLKAHRLKNPKSRKALGQDLRARNPKKVVRKNQEEVKVVKNQLNQLRVKR